MSSGGREQQVVDLRVSQVDECTECGCRIVMMCFRGTGVCSQRCEKVRDAST